MPSCTTPWSWGVVTRLISNHVVEVDGMPRHVKDLRIFRGDLNNTDFSIDQCYDSDGDYISDTDYVVPASGEGDNGAPTQNDEPTMPVETGQEARVDDRPIRDAVARLPEGVYRDNRPYVRHIDDHSDQNLLPNEDVAMSPTEVRDLSQELARLSIQNGQMEETQSGDSSRNPADMLELQPTASGGLSEPSNIVRPSRERGPPSNTVRGPPASCRPLGRGKQLPRNQSVEGRPGRPPSMTRRPPRVEAPPRVNERGMHRTNRPSSIARRPPATGAPRVIERQRSTSRPPTTGRQPPAPEGERRYPSRIRKPPDRFDPYSKRK